MKLAENIPEVIL